MVEPLAARGQTAMCQAFVFLEAERFEVKVQPPTAAEAEVCVTAAVF